MIVAVDFRKSLRLMSPLLQLGLRRSLLKALTRVLFVVSGLRLAAKDRQS
jgi:hypothetical protein